MKKKVVIIGSAWPLRGGGIATFNERLAKQFMDEGHEVIIYTFSLQYPSFLFPGKSQYATEPKPLHLTIKEVVNSVNPFNWVRIGNEIKKMAPDLVVVRYWIPFMGPCLGTIASIIRKNKTSKVVCIADNVVPHEKRPLDTLFTKYFVGQVDAFVTLSEKVQKDLTLFTQKPSATVVHPLYDNFGEPISKLEARKKLELDAFDPIILFFGFIRAYKGLDLLLRALGYLKKQGKIIPTLVIAGEFYDKKEPYLQIIAEEDLTNDVIVKSDFIADTDVRNYFCATDFVIQPYKHATQSGITPLCFHFNKPMLVTNVGALASMVPNNVVGVVTEPDYVSIAHGIEKLYALGEPHFTSAIEIEKKKYNWNQLTHQIWDLIS
jgi:glycosyltransferase involved in cell wall biosynthesis